MATAMQTAEGRDLQEILERYPNAGRDALIPILQDLQDVFGYLSRDMIARVGAYLHLPVSKIYGVATFYNQFRFAALGKYHIQVCRGTACHVKGSAGVLDDIRRQLNLEPGETSRDGLFSLEVVACIGACGLAPVIRVNDEFYAEMTTSKIERVFKTLKKEAESHD